VTAVTIAAMAVLGCTSPSESSVEAPSSALSIGVASDNPGSIWLAAGSGGAFVSTTGGHSWKRVFGASGFRTFAFVEKGTVFADGRRLRFSPSNGRRAIRRPGAPVSLTQLASPYPPTNRLYALDTRGHIWLSVQAGLGWQPLRGQGLPPDPTAIAALRGTPTQADTIYVAAVDGLWMSTDFGSTFHHIPGAAGGTSVATTTDAPLRVLVGGNNGIFLSQNGAATFTRVSRQPITAVAFDWRNGQNAVATTPNGDLLRSTDGGVTWPA
jgi:photosystem II stability/assembly factor-like uncharacterized protein